MSQPDRAADSPWVCQTFVALAFVFRFRSEESLLGQHADEVPPANTLNEHAADDTSARHSMPAEPKPPTLWVILHSPKVHLYAFWILLYVGLEVTIGGWIVTYIVEVRNGGPTPSSRFRACARQRGPLPDSCLYRLTSRRSLGRLHLFGFLWRPHAGPHLLHPPDEAARRKVVNLRLHDGRPRAPIRSLFRALARGQRRCRLVRRRLHRPTLPDCPVGRHQGLASLARRRRHRLDRYVFSTRSATLFVLDELPPPPPPLLSLLWPGRLGRLPLHRRRHLGPPRAGQLEPRRRCDAHPPYRALGSGSPDPESQGLRETSERCWRAIHATAIRPAQGCLLI